MQRKRFNVLWSYSPFDLMQKPWSVLEAKGIPAFLSNAYIGKGVDQWTLTAYHVGMWINLARSQQFAVIAELAPHQVPGDALEMPKEVWEKLLRNCALYSL